MTRTGCICMIVIMLVSAGGMIVCGMARRKDGLPRAGRGPRNDAGAELPTVTGEPVIFRRAEQRILTCRASMELDDGAITARGYSAGSPEQRAQAERYARKELAYLLTDQLLEAGGIRFVSEGTSRRAEIKAVLPEGSGTA